MMLNQVRVTQHHVTFLAPIVPVAADVPIHEQPYSSSLLLPLPALSSAILCNHEFVTACEYGYDAYFEEMYTSDLVFSRRDYTPSTLLVFLRDELFPSDVDLAAFQAAGCQISLAWRVGFVFGWLSALAKYQAALAKQGLRMMVGLVRERGGRG